MRNRLRVFGTLALLSALYQLSGQNAYASDRRLSNQQIGELALSGGWVSGTVSRKCAEDEIAGTSEHSPDLNIHQSGKEVSVNSSGEDQSEYLVKRARRDESLPDIVLELSITGGGEGESWTGHSLWFLHSDEFDASNPNVIRKTDVLTIVDWVETRQRDGEKSATKVDNPVPTAWTYVRCSP